MREPPIPAATIRGNLPPPAPASNEPPPEGVVVVPTYKLFTPGQMVLATFLGTPFAGCFLLGRNFGKLRRPVAAWLAYGGGALVTALVVYVALAVPSFPRIFSLTGVVAVYAIGKALQGDTVDQHERNGGPRASWWAAVGLSLLTTLCWAVLGVGAFVAYELATATPSVERNGGEVFHANGATAAEATALADLLVELEYFDGDPASVRLQREGDRMVALFVVKESAIRAEKVKAFFEALASKLSERVLGGEPLDIYLTNDVWERQTSIPWESRARDLKFGKDMIRVRRGATDEAGKRLGVLLQRLDYFGGDGVSVIFDRHSRFRVTFVVDPEVVDADLAVQYHRFAWQISKHVVNDSPVDILLVDPESKPLHRLSWDKRPPDPVVAASGNLIYRLEACTEDDARNTADVLASLLAAHPSAEIWIECGDRVELTIGEKLDFRDVPVDELSKRVFGDRPIDLAIEDGGTSTPHAWEDRPRKRKQK